MLARRLMLAAVILLQLGALAAQEPPASELTRDGSLFIHDASKSRFTLPKDWEATRPESVGSIAKLAVRLPEYGVEATLTWSPLVGKMDEALDLETTELQQKYGKDRVSRKDPITVDNKPVFVIAVEDGTARDVPTRQGKELGVVYLFEAGADERSRWKIKVRGTYPKADGDAGLKRVEALLRSFQW